MKLRFSLLLQSFFVFLGNGCATEVGNPGDKKKPAEMGNGQNNEVPREDVSYEIPPVDSVTVGSGTVIDTGEPGVHWTVDLKNLKQCSVEVKTTKNEVPISFSLSYSKDESIAATDVKFFFYNSESRLVERNHFIPNEAGVYKVYALSYSLKAGCFNEANVSEEDLQLPQTRTTVLKAFSN